MGRSSIKKHLLYAGIGEQMATKLARIREISAKDAKTEFTSIYHMIDKELLRECHKRLNGNKAVGVDGVTKESYDENLEENLDSLIVRLKNKSYKPMPSKRVYIPKLNGKKRPLGIASYEDKLVQYALKCLLEVVYEPRFLNCMFGFRPNRGCHDALKALNRMIENSKTSYVIDADIKGFFNNMSHDWIAKFLGVHIKDPNVLWLVGKFLKAGVSEDGIRSETDKGSEQGNLASPIIANIYMHYALTLWFERVVKKQCRGECGLVVYADDFVTCFQYKDDAERFYDVLQERLAKFGLELEKDKSRLLEFGRFAEENRKNKGMGRPETFNFLGFTHYCSKSKNGRFRVKRRTENKKFRNKLKGMNLWLKSNRNLPLKDYLSLLNTKLLGHYHYFGITDNAKQIGKFYYRTYNLLYKWINNRSQRKSYTYEGLKQMLRYYPLAQPRIYVNIYG